ncbi:MAG: SprT-like domain-containing protein [Actinomycetaceae bacterium]|nr:SprT-like domain-containing protein [Actinomycetaceae bacterium]
MELPAIAELARLLMDRHGLDGWSLRFDRARRRAGLTRFDDRTISLSGVLLPLYSEQQVRDVVLHEIAHALVGPRHNHDATWRAQARQIGAPPRATLVDAPQAPATWIGRCPNGHEVPRYRRPSGQRSCGKCSKSYDPRFTLTWHRVG